MEIDHENLPFGSNRMMKMKFIILFGSLQALQAWLSQAF
jgi:hypothetical protein